MKNTILLCLLFVGLSTLGQKKSVHKAFDSLINHFAKTEEFSGSVLVAEKGKVLYQKSIGLANRQFNIPISNKSLFKICSITKTFTATIILQLMEAGKIDLNNTIGFYYPEYPGPARDKATILNLLTYSSGIENIDQSSEEMYALEYSLDTIINKFCAGKLVTEPGTKMDYKNGDYIILGKIIERITGKSFEIILQEFICKPLGLANTGMLTSKVIVPAIIDGYIKDSSGKFLNEDPYRIENFYSSGAMYSTVEDLYKFDQALFLHKLLTKQTVDFMTTSFPKLWNVALSFWVVDQRFGNITTTVMDRRGNIGGMNIAWYHIFEGNKTILVCSNSNASDVTAIRQQLGEILLSSSPTVKK